MTTTKETTTKEIATKEKTTHYLALTQDMGEDFKEAMIENLQDEDTTPFDVFEMVSVPRAPGAPWMIPIMNENGSDVLKIDEFSGIILHIQNNKAIFEHDYDSDEREEGARPICASLNGRTGIGNPGGNCGTCPNNQFGSGKGNSKACSDSKLIYVLMEDKPLPIVVKITPGTSKDGSFAELKKYLLTLTRAGFKKHAVETKFVLGTAQNAKKIEYVKVIFKMDKTIKDNTLIQSIESYRNALLPHISPRIEQSELRNVA